MPLYAKCNAKQANVFGLLENKIREVKISRVIYDIVSNANTHYQLLLLSFKISPSQFVSTLLKQLRNAWFGISLET